MPIFRIVKTKGSSDSDFKIEQRLYYSNSNSESDYKVVEGYHFLNNDVLNDKLELIDSSRGKLIPGCLKLKTNSMIKLNKRGVPVFQFLPFDKLYPAFYVASNNKSRTDLYITIRFLSWDKDSKYPSGEIVHVF